MFIMLDENILVAGQISPADVEEAKALGVTTIINNRPDGEVPDQPSGASIEKAAHNAGLAYVAIPVTHSGISMDQVVAMRAAVSEAQGKILAFCRSGTRSTNLWSLALASGGEEPDRLVAKAAAAGYDLSGLRPTLHQLSANARS